MPRTLKKKPAAKPAGKARAYDKLAAMFSDLEPASDILKKVVVVPTLLPQMDHALRIGGLPLQRTTIVHGPTHEGKSSLCLVLIASFLARKHMGCLIDAERTTTIDWVRGMVGKLADDKVRFKAGRPDTYEETILMVRKWLKALRTAREEGLVDEDTGGILVVDSLRKLMPEGELEMIMGEKDATAGRSGQRRAQMNAAWFDELVPMLDHAMAAAVVIAREMEDTSGDVWAKRMGMDWKLGGGKSVGFEAAVAMRVMRQSYTKRGDEIVGERHKVMVWKNKCAGKDGRNTLWYFHTSNGVDCPEGHDPIRDYAELGEKLGLSPDGSSFAGTKFRGRDAMIKALREKPEMMAELEKQVRANMERKPLEHDEDGVIQ